MSNPFAPAVKYKSRLRLAIDGPAGSGKTYTALVAATVFARAGKGKIALVDTEFESASLYSDLFKFDTVPLTTFHPKNYIEMIHAAELNDYDVLVIDSLSHAWVGAGGVLDIVDKATMKNYGNSFVGWKDATPIQRQLVDAILQSKLHIICTMRTKTEWTLEENEKGKKVPKKIGLAPVQRPDLDYEFTVFAEMDYEHNFVVSKTRCPVITDAVMNRPDEAFFTQVLTWLNSGADRIQTVVPTPAVTAPAPAAIPATVSTPVQTPAPVSTPAPVTKTPAPAPATKAPATPPAKASIPAMSVEQILGSHAIQSAMLTLTGAKSFATSGNPPKRYGDMTQDELCQAFSAMAERVKNPQGGTNTAVLSSKMDGIYMILAEMNGANTQAPVSTLVPTQPAEEVQESLI